MDQRGWSDIGYNFVVCQHGHVYEGRGIGIQGAHAGDSDIGGNDRWYGIQAMVGQGDRHPDALYDGLQAAIRHCRSHGAGNRINGHRDHHATECPGDALYRWAHGTPMEEDMPTAEEIARAVWTWDGIATPEQWRDPDNPAWMAKLGLRGAWQQSTDARVLGQKILAVVQRLAENDGVEVNLDEAALASELLPGILAELDADTIAAAVTEAMPEYRLVKQ